MVLHDNIIETKPFFLVRLTVRAALQQNPGLQKSQMRLQMSPGRMLPLHHDQRGN